MQVELHESPFSKLEADSIIATHDGNMALLWLYMRQNPKAHPKDAAYALCRTQAEIDAAWEKLIRMAENTKVAAEAEQKRIPKVVRPEPEEELPDYPNSDVAAHSRDNPCFAALVTEAQRALGRILSTSDLKKLFGLYDYLSLPPEVIMVLINYCKSLYPAGNPPSMRQIEKEGFSWERKGVVTLEHAEEYIVSSQQRHEKISQVVQLLGITGRALSPSERKYLNSWLDMGFGEEAISIAYGKTTDNTGGLKWSYMNGILKKWHEKGLHTPAEIKEKDTRKNKCQVGKQNYCWVDMDKMLAELDSI